MLDNPVDNTEVDSIEGVDGGNLPSLTEEQKLSLEKFQFSDELQAKYFKHGKLLGRFDDIEGLLSALKSVEDKHSNLVRELKQNQAKEPEPVQQTQQTQQNTQADIYEIAAPLAKQFIDGGMELTDEIIQEATAKGLDIRDVKLAAIELKEKITEAYSYVGGKSEYEAMLEWGKANLSDKQKASFDKDVSTGLGEFAIKGLYAQYKASTIESAPQERIRGDSNAPIVDRGYSSIQELIRDREYLKTPQGKADKAAQELHRRRMDKTHDSVIYGR